MPERFHFFPTNQLFLFPLNHLVWSMYTTSVSPQLDAFSGDRGLEIGIYHSWQQPVSGHRLIEKLCYSLQSGRIVKLDVIYKFPQKSIVESLI